MRVELNIGMGNNPFDISQAAHLVTSAMSAHGAKNIAFRLDHGDYVGTKENTLVFSLEYDNQDVPFQELLEALAVIMTQECIAFYVPEWNDGGLTFSHSYDGEYYDFNMKYFIRF